jgi:hypothetical protein
VPLAEHSRKSIARLEVEVNTSLPGPFEERIEIYLAGRPIPTILPVSGMVKPPVELVPRSVLLPLMTESGPLYKAKCLCRSTEGKPVTLRVESSPPGIHVHLGEGDNTSSVRTVHIEWDGKESELPSVSTRVVRLKAGIGNTEVTLEIPIVCRAKGT